MSADNDMSKKDPSGRRRLTASDIETGGALVEHLQGMGIDVSVDIASYRKALAHARSDNSKTGKARYMCHAEGGVYGFSYKGVIHLDLTKVDGELPVHEYAHLWCEAFRYLNREGWSRLVTLAKGDKDTWDLIKDTHPGIKDENDLVEEAIATFSGKRGALRLELELRRMTMKDNDYKRKWNNIYRNISKVLQDFWRHVGTYMSVNYRSMEEVCDRVLKDLVDGVNPRKDIERYLRARDEEYMRAAMTGDTRKAMSMMGEALRENIGNGMTPYITVGGYRELRLLARKVKTGDMEALGTAAAMMAPLVPKDAVIVPTPSHTGRATDMLALSRMISRKAGVPVCDILRSEPRESQYSHKNETGKPMRSSELGIVLSGTLPEGRIPLVIDNVISSGNTAEACIQALGTGVMLALADADGDYTRAVTLKSAQPVARDRKGRIVPLSGRFDLSPKAKKMLAGRHTKGRGL